MELRISSRHAELSPALKQYIDKKLHKFDRHLPNVQSVSVEMTSQVSRSQGEMHVAQGTLHVGREVLRAEVQASDPFEAVDLMVTKLQRQVERYKGKRRDRRQGRGNLAAPVPTSPDTVIDEATEEADDEDAPVVRRKRFAIFPMDEDEAIEQMELLGHDFFLYQNPTSGRINLVYRRKEGGYGLLEPEIA
jgi:putative sigma-54 modulation protein